MHPRPLSPHLQVYKPQITSFLSILHRFTGLFLSFGSVFIVAWLFALAFAPNTYNSFVGIVQSIYGKVGLLGWAFCFFYHLSNGIRHLFWDMGRGFEMRNVRRSGWGVIVTALILTAGVASNLLYYKKAPVVSAQSTQQQAVAETTYLLGSYSITVTY
jgi:succinate dehydrogenase / fumarate reductase cytochrome b subunit